MEDKSQPWAGVRNPVGIEMPVEDRPVIQSRRPFPGGETLPKPALGYVPYRQELEIQVSVRGKPRLRAHVRSLPAPAGRFASAGESEGILNSTGTGLQLSQAMQPGSREQK